MLIACIHHIHSIYIEYSVLISTNINIEHITNKSTFERCVRVRDRYNVAWDKTSNGVTHLGWRSDSIPLKLYGIVFVTNKMKLEENERGWKLYTTSMKIDEHPFIFIREKTADIHIQSYLPFHLHAFRHQILVIIMIEALMFNR